MECGQQGQGLVDQIMENDTNMIGGGMAAKYYEFFAGIWYTDS